MTTPEKLRRRQYREGVALILIGIFTVAQAIYFNVQDDRQGQCIADKVNEIDSVFAARAGLADQDTALDKMDAALAKKRAARSSQVILAVGNIRSAAQFQALEARYKAQVHRIAAGQAKITRQRAMIAAQRKNHPVPAFPPGACGSSATSAAAVGWLNEIAARMP